MRVALRNCLVLLLVAVQYSKATAELDMRHLAELAVRNEERFKSTPSSWIVSSPLGDGGSANLSVLHVGEVERFIFTFEHGARSDEICRIISRGGLWYVSDEKGLRKYRAWEMPAEHGTFYFCLEDSPLKFVNGGAAAQLGPVDEIEGNTATFSQPLPAAQAEVIRNGWKARQAFLRESPDVPNAAKLRADIEATKAFGEKLIAHGFPSHVDLSTGLLVGRGNLWRIRDFKFLDSVDERELATDRREWADHADDPTTGNLNDLAMVTHLGTSYSDLEGRLIDVRSGRFKRIPFNGYYCSPVGFLAGRNSVIVFGADTTTMQFRPYEINLSTGVNRPFPGHLFDAGFIHGGAISFDGKSMALAHTGASPDFLDNQIYVVDLASGETRAVGKPFAGPTDLVVRWMPDGRRLLFTQFDRDGPGKSHESIMLMDMAGNAVCIRRGHLAVPLPDGGRILFSERPTALWNSCELDGGNVQLFANGLPDCLCAAVGPDGGRLLMTQRTEGWLRLVLYNLGETEGTVVSDESGNWVQPVWR